MDVYEKSLELHKEHQGKLEISVKVPCDTKEDLALAYTPGVAACCLKIDDDKENVFIGNIFCSIRNRHFLKRYIFNFFSKSDSIT